MKLLSHRGHPLRKPLSGVRKILFLAIATQPGITKAQLCALSHLRGGDISRLSHHLLGLEDEGFIRVVQRSSKNGKLSFRISKSKGKKMLKRLNYQKQ